MVILEAERMAKLMGGVMKYPWTFLLFADASRVSEYRVSTNDEMERIFCHKLPGVTKEKKQKP